MDILGCRLHLLGSRKKRIQVVSDDLDSDLGIDARDHVADKVRQRTATVADKGRAWVSDSAEAVMAGRGEARSSVELHLEAEEWRRSAVRFANAERV